MGLSLGLSGIILALGHGEPSVTLYFANWIYIALLLKELLVGFFIGFIASELFYAMDSAGRALDVARGFHQVETKLPGLNGYSTPIGQLNFQLLLINFGMMNGHIYFIENIMNSFHTLPVYSLPDLGGGLDILFLTIMKYSSGLLSLGPALVFPGLFAVFLTDVIFGICNHIAPQLRAYFIAMGVKSIVGLLMVFATIHLLTEKIFYHAKESIIFVQYLIASMA